MGARPACSLVPGEPFARLPSARFPSRVTGKPPPPSRGRGLGGAGLGAFAGAPGSCPVLWLKRRSAQPVIAQLATMTNTDSRPPSRPLDRGAPGLRRSFAHAPPRGVGQAPQTPLGRRVHTWDGGNHLLFFPLSRPYLGHNTKF